MYRCIYLDMKKNVQANFVMDLKTFTSWRPREKEILNIQNDFLKFEYNSNDYRAGI